MPNHAPARPALTMKPGALEYRYKRVSSGYWQFALFAGDQQVINYQGRFSGPDGRDQCLARIALVQQAGEGTPVRKVLSF